MTNLARYQQVFMDTFSVPGDALNETFTFAGVEAWDSMAHMVLISALEDAFDVLFDTREILQYGSYLNGIKILEGHGVNFEE